MSELFIADWRAADKTSPRSIETLASEVAGEMAHEDDFNRMTKRLIRKFDAKEVEIHVEDDDDLDASMICYAARELQDYALGNLMELLPQLGIKMKG